MHLNLGGLLLLLGLALSSDWALAQDEVESNAKLTVVPTEISGTTSPFTLSIHNKKIIEKESTITYLQINGIPVDISEENTFSDSRTDNTLSISVAYSDGRTEDLPPIELPSLESLQYLSSSRLTLYLNGKVQEVYIDKNKVSVTGKATTLPDSPYWFGFNHVVKLEGAGNNPDRFYNMKLFRKEEFAELKEQGELKPNEVLKSTTVLNEKSDAEKNKGEKTETRKVASEDHPTHFNIKFEGGLSLKNVITEPAFNTSPISSFTGSVFGDISLFDSFSFLLGASYVQKGAALPNFKNKFTYIEVVGLLQAKINLWPIKPFLQAGGALGFLISAMKEFTSGATTDVSATLEKLDYGILFGGGFEVTLYKNFSFYVVTRYELGLKDIDIDSTSTTKNSGFRFLGGVALAL